MAQATSQPANKDSSRCMDGLAYNNAAWLISRTKAKPNHAKPRRGNTTPALVPVPLEPSTNQFRTIDSVMAELWFPRPDSDVWSMTDLRIVKHTADQDKPNVMYVLYVQPEDRENFDDDCRKHYSPMLLVKHTHDHLVSFTSQDLGNIKRFVYEWLDPTLIESDDLYAGHSLASARLRTAVNCPCTPLSVVYTTRLRLDTVDHLCPPMSSSSLVNAVLFQPELFRLVVAYADIHDYFTWRYTCRAMHLACEDILYMDFRHELSFWCPHSAISEVIKHIEHQDTIVVGAAALAVLRLHTLGPLSNLQLVCPWAAMESWTAFARELEWVQCGRTSNEDVEVVRFMSTKDTLATIQGVKSVSPVQYVVQAPESALFTFIDSKGVHCGYPVVTLDNVTFSLRKNTLGYRLGWDSIVVGPAIPYHSLGPYRGNNRGNESVDPFHPVLFPVPSMSFLEICLTPNILLSILLRLPFLDWISLSNTCLAAHNGAQTSFECLFESRLSNFVRYDHLHHFIGLLHYSDSVIVGALPLAMLGLTTWGPDKELIVHSPLATKWRWQRRFGWRLTSELEVREEGGVHTIQNFCYEEASTRFPRAARSLTEPKIQTAKIKLIYTDGPRVLALLCKAPETALFTFMSSTVLCTAYPRTTLKRRTLCANLSLDGYMAGAECLTQFSPIAFLPDGYDIARKWTDSHCLSFRYTPFVPDIVAMGGNIYWDLSGTGANR
ncbi:hypothetical protein K435DRAFT_865788 [Dendrothele bispora CBS 962.96]|uniref:F-box domain-containing protein n=1 Tax=Dendrothele bispora (strain CBS 962.96) TaxID=1314807 RepID=A0A4S8LIN3_DENBC|nr:hypothetical protein K435DRAFT_865788 [Dendrothele bispora CBS 962.96]